MKPSAVITAISALLETITLAASAPEGNAALAPGLLRAALADDEPASDDIDRRFSIIPSAIEDANNNDPTRRVIDLMIDVGYWPGSDPVACVGRMADDMTQIVDALNGYQAADIQSVEVTQFSPPSTSPIVDGSLQMGRGIRVVYRYS